MFLLLYAWDKRYVWSKPFKILEIEIVGSSCAAAI